eukprot:7579014-Karenia_brevis.AAC.1
MDTWLCLSIPERTLRHANRLGELEWYSISTPSLRNVTSLWLGPGLCDNIAEPTALACPANPPVASPEGISTIVGPG